MFQLHANSWMCVISSSISNFFPKPHSVFLSGPENSCANIHRLEDILDGNKDISTRDVQTCIVILLASTISVAVDLQLLATKGFSEKHV